jgi:hypothetical protein
MYHLAIYIYTYISILANCFISILESNLKGDEQNSSVLEQVIGPNLDGKK